MFSQNRTGIIPVPELLASVGGILAVDSLRRDALGENPWWYAAVAGVVALALFAWGVQRSASLGAAFVVKTVLFFLGLGLLLAWPSPWASAVIVLGAVLYAVGYVMWSSRATPRATNETVSTA